MKSAKKHKQMDFVKQFSAELEKSDPEPELLALYIAGMAYPNLDIEANQHRLDRIAALVGEHLTMHAPGRARAECFLSVLNADLKFDGNRKQYYDSRNSYLNQVLERRVGLPITLSLLCIAIGRRLHKLGLDIRVEGLGLPGHFMARYQDEDGIWLLDPFNGAVVDPDETTSYLAHLFQQPVALPKEALRPVSAPVLAYRMLNNLRVVYLETGEYDSAVDILDYMLVLAPDDPSLWRERGLLHYQVEDWERASRDIRRYFFLQGNLLLALGLWDASDAAFIEDMEYDAYEYDDEYADEYDDEFDEDSAGDAIIDDDMADATEYRSEIFPTFSMDGFIDTEDAYEHRADAFDGSFYGDEYGDELYDDALAQLSVEDQYLLQILGEIEDIRSRLN